MKLKFFGREIVLGKEIAVIGTAALLLLGCLSGYIFLRNDSDIIIEGEGKMVTALAADAGEAGSTASVSTSAAKASTVRAQGTDTSGGSAPDSSKQSDDTICVYVVGCVKSPGIVTIKKGQLINDAVMAAGGLTSEADAENINLVYSLNENVMLNIKSKQTPAYEQSDPTGQAAAAGMQTTSGTQSPAGQRASHDRQGSAEQEKTATEQAVSFAGSGAEIRSASGSSAVISGGSETDGGTPETGKAKNLVNINTAGADELDTLPGVGEATARDIIAFREKNGRFSRIEDIMKVPRIKQNRFDNLKDYITVD